MRGTPSPRAVKTRREIINWITPICTALHRGCLTHAACRYRHRLGIQSDFLASQRQFYSTGDIERNGIPPFFRSTGLPRLSRANSRSRGEEKKREKEKRKTIVPFHSSALLGRTLDLSRGKRNDEKRREKEEEGKKQ